MEWFDGQDFLIEYPFSTQTLIVPSPNIVQEEPISGSFSLSTEVTRDEPKPLNATLYTALCENVRRRDVKPSTSSSANRKREIQQPTNAKEKRQRNTQYERDRFKKPYIAKVMSHLASTIKLDKNMSNKEVINRVTKYLNMKQKLKEHIRIVRGRSKRMDKQIAMLQGKLAAL